MTKFKLSDKVFVEIPFFEGKNHLVEGIVKDINPNYERYRVEFYFGLMHHTFWYSPNEMKLVKPKRVGFRYSKGVVFSV